MQAFRSQIIGIIVSYFMFKVFTTIFKIHNFIQKYMYLTHLYDTFWATYMKMPLKDVIKDSNAITDSFMVKHVHDNILAIELITLR